MPFYLKKTIFAHPFKTVDPSVLPVCQSSLCRPLTGFQNTSARFLLLIIASQGNDKGMDDALSRVLWAGLGHTDPPLLVQTQHFPFRTWIGYLSNHCHGLPTITHHIEQIKYIQKQKKKRKEKNNSSVVQSECLCCSYRCDLNGLRKCNRRGSGGGDTCSCGAALLAGRVLLHSCSQKLCLSLLQQQLLLRWSQSQLQYEWERDRRTEKERQKIIRNEMCWTIILGYI